jgi:hypothetical protein
VRLVGELQVGMYYLLLEGQPERLLEQAERVVVFAVLLE